MSEIIYEYSDYVIIKRACHLVLENVCSVIGPLTQKIFEELIDKFNRFTSSNYLPITLAGTRAMVRNKTKFLLMVLTI
jgi:hypothetical protein